MDAVDIPRPAVRPQSVYPRTENTTAGRRHVNASPGPLTEMAAAIPGARLVVIEDCGHLAPLERPEVVTRALREWLAQKA